MIWVGLRSFLLSLAVWYRICLIKVACSSKDNNENNTMRANLGILGGTTETWTQLKKKKKKSQPHYRDMTLLNIVTILPKASLCLCLFI